MSLIYFEAHILNEGFNSNCIHRPKQYSNHCIILIFSDDGEVAAFVVAFDEILSGSFQTFCELSQKIGGDVMTHGAMAEAAFKSQREFLVIASKSKKPSDKDLQSLLLPLSTKISEIQDFREKNRRSVYFNHLSALSESIPALGWVTVVRIFLSYIR